MNNAIQHLYEKVLAFSLKKMNIGSGGDIYQNGELNVFKYIDKTLNLKKLVIFDVGANIGQYSQAASNYFKERASIYAFEPSPKTFAALQEKIKTDKQIKAFNIGLSNRSTSKVLYSNKERSKLASLYERRLDHYQIDFKKHEQVKLETVDNFCINHQIKKLHFLKIDTEGHELAVLNGAAKMMTSNKIAFIQFEFGGCHIDSRTFFQDFYYLLNKKYILYRILQNGFYRIEAYKELYEQFATTNYLAESRNN